MKRLTILLSFIFLLIAAIISCKHEVPLAPAGPGNPGTPGGGTPGGGGTNPGGGTGSTLVCFETEVLPIFQTNCAKSGCHDANSRQKDYVLDNYNNIMGYGNGLRSGITPGDASDSKIYKVLFETGSDKMPRPPNPDLTPAQKALIGRWINEGAQNTTNCNTTTGCDTTLFRYNADVKPILATNCTGCHGGTTPSAGLNFTLYDVVRQVGLNGRLIGAITHSPGYSPMPKNANKLTDCKITQIKKWVASGAPNN